VCRGLALTCAGAGGERHTGGAAFLDAVDRLREECPGVFDEIDARADELAAAPVSVEAPTTDSCPRCRELEALVRDLTDGLDDCRAPGEYSALVSQSRRIVPRERLNPGAPPTPAGAGPSH
jgi:hypothetical protein